MVKVKGVPNEYLKAFEKEMKRKSVKYQILFRIGVECGLRVSDILNITVHDYYTGFVTEKKTKKVKEVKLSKETKKIIDGHIKRNGLSISNYIIFSSTTRFDTPLSRRQAHYVIRAVGGKLGLNLISTHSLRKTYARLFFNKHKDIEKLRVELNHKYVTTTLLYLFDDLNAIQLV